VRRRRRCTHLQHDLGARAIVLDHRQDAVELSARTLDPVDDVEAFHVVDVHRCSDQRVLVTAFRAGRVSVLLWVQLFATYKVASAGLARLGVVISAEKHWESTIHDVSIPLGVGVWTG
jgi:hypothetical protein